MTMGEYINTVNSLVSVAVSGISISKYTIADVKYNLPSALTNPCIRNAKSIVDKHYKLCHKTVIANRKRTMKVKAPKLPVLKKKYCYVNNQNFKVSNHTISFPVMISGKSKRVSVATKMSERQRRVFSLQNIHTTTYQKWTGQLLYSGK